VNILDRSLWRSCVALGGSLLLVVSAGGEERPASSNGASGGVAAKVAGHAITLGEVTAAVQATFGERPLAGAMQTLAEAQTLEQLINRRLVTLALDRAKITATSEEIAAARKKLAASDQPSGSDDAQLAERLDWQIRWNKYLGQQITDKRLEEFFAAHPRDFDGTEVRVSHILLKGDAQGSPAVRGQLEQRAERLRREIVAGQLTFAAAAEQHSDGPSRRSGGDLGFFPRHERMVEAFAKAAFALAKGEISTPVVTPFGVHLIQCTDIRPGSKTWADVRSELAAAYAQEQFRTLADEMRPSVKIEYNPAVPHLDPKTGQVVGGKSLPAGR
jgi:parvulin-like peptidyl-prolyl isomerase